MATNLVVWTGRACIQLYFILTIIVSYIARHCSYVYGLLADSHIANYNNLPGTVDVW